MPLREIDGPVGGSANGSAFIKTPSRFCPPSAMQNVRVQGSSSKRLRFGQRKGLKRLFSRRMGVGGWDVSGSGSPVQALDVIQAITGVVGSTRGSLNLVTSITNRPGGAITGLVWILNNSTGMVDAISDPYGAIAGSTLLPAAFYAAWCIGNPDLLVWGRLFRNDTTGQILARIGLYNAATRTHVWSATVPDNAPGGSDAGQSIIPNAVRVYPFYTFVAASQYIYVFTTADGVYRGRFTPSGWADEVQDVRLRADGKLYALFTGARVVGGVVPAATPNVLEGQFVRSGIALFEINTNPATPLTHIAFGQTITSGANYENHQTFRFSEHLQRKFRGALPFAFGVDPSGNAYAGYTNRGWGKTLATDLPDSTFPPTTVCKVSSAGVLQWEADTFSILDQYTQGGRSMVNDIPGGGDRLLGEGPGGPEPSINAIAVDAAGNVYAGGRRNLTPVDQGDNLFKLSPTGELQWKTRVSGMVYQHCICVDPLDGNIIVGGERNQDWEGTSDGGTGPRQAHLWKFNAGNGAVMWHQDLNAAVSCFAVDVNTRGEIVYATNELS